ncbi:MAG TPA: head-tail connector protein [Rhizomicrobium sp.]|nr:head-tail connector protein [Rhizomicrobium sp.]
MSEGRHHVRRTLTLLTAGESPLSLDEVKAHLRVETDDDDDLIMALIDAARNYVDGRDGILGRALLTQQWRMQRERFSWYPFPYAAAPYDYTWLNRDWAWDPWAWRRAFSVYIPLPPLVSIDSVTYLGADSAETPTTMNPSAYKIVQGGNFESYLLPVTGTTWPATAIEPDAVTIDFTCGYASVAALNAERRSIGQAMKLMVGLWYENREAALVANRAASVELSFAVQTLLAPHRLPGSMV